MSRRRLVETAATGASAAELLRRMADRMEAGETPAGRAFMREGLRAAKRMDLPNALRRIEAALTAAAMVLNRIDISPDDCRVLADVMDEGTQQWVDSSLRRG